MLSSSTPVDASAKGAGEGLLGVGHADYNGPVDKIFLHPPSLPQPLPGSLFSCTQGNSGKVVFTIKISGSLRAQSWSEYDSNEAQTLVSIAIPRVLIGNW